VKPSVAFPFVELSPHDVAKTATVANANKFLTLIIQYFMFRMTVSGIFTNDYIKLLCQ